MFNERLLILAITLLCFTSVAPAGMISTIGEQPGAQLDVIGVTGYATMGSHMGGLEVTAVYAGGGPQVCTWAPSSATAGGCGVAGVFSIAEDGDTFSNNWHLQNLSTFDSLQLLVLNGTPGRGAVSGTVFDRTFDNAFGTLGSFAGADATGTTSGVSDGSGVYSDMVAIAPNVPVGDLFTTLTIRFDGNGLGPGQSAMFLADTDTIGEYVVPEPSTLGLLALGLFGIGVVGRRRLAAKH